MKTRPHVKVHNGIRNHPRYASAFADPRVRGMVVGLWSVAADRFASRTGDQITLTSGDLLWITGTSAVGPAYQALRSMCSRMGYSIATRGGEHGGREPLTVTVSIRNFSRKQGFPERNPPPNNDHRSRQSTPSDTDPDSDTNKKTPPTPSRAREEERGVGSIDPRSGNGSTNGSGHEPTPDVATFARVLEVWCSRFGNDRVEGQHDNGSFVEDLEARIVEEPRLGEWLHLCDQVARQPFLAFGLEREQGPVTLAWLVHDRERIHRAKHMRYAPDREARR